VSGLSNRLWASVNERSISIGYRWVALALAGLLIVSAAMPPRALVLLAIAGFVNLVLTLCSRQYVRLLLVYPTLLLGELMLGLGLVTLSGGLSSPFQAYSYAPLILPALLWSWRGRLAAAALLTAGNVLLLWAGTRVPLPALLTGQLGTWVSLLGPTALVLLLPLAQQATQRSARRSGRRSAIQPRGALSQRAVQDLHDTVVQQLSVGGRPTTRVAEPAVADVPVAAPLSVARAAPEPSSLELRRSIFGPLPSADVALDKVLYQLVKSFGRRSPVVTRLTVIGPPPSLPPSAHSTLVRLAQESLLNVEQHARASSATVTLRCEPRTVLLAIQDDGVGLLDGTHERPGLHALRAIAYRLAEVGGRLEVREHESGGLTVQGSIPLGPSDSTS
jgi:signal transduction histidine kinase